MSSRSYGATRSKNRGMGSTLKVRQAALARASRRQAALLARAASRMAASNENRTMAPIYGRPSSSEVKGVDSDVSQQVIATTSTNAGIDVLNLIIPGSGSYNRIGRKTILKSARLKGSISWLVTPTVATGVYRQASCRAVLVWDMQPTGTIPTFDTIFGTTLQAGTEQVTSIWDPIRYDGMERFRVIKEWCWNPAPIPVSSTGSGPQNRTTESIDEYVRLPNLLSNYSGQTSPQTIADIASGALYLVWRADADSGNITTTIDAMVRLRYYD